VGQVACKLPWSTPARRVGLVSAAAGVWALLALYLVVGRLTGNCWAAAVAALVLATGSIFWRHGSRAGPETLGVALTLTGLHLGLAEGAVRRMTAGLCAGLALCSDPASLLVLPVTVAAVTGGSRRGRGMVAFVAGLLIGLSPALQLLGFAGEPLLPRGWGDGAASIRLLGHYLVLIPSQTGWLLWPVALLGALALIWSRARGGEPPLGCGPSARNTHCTQRPLARAVRQDAGRGVGLLLGLLVLIGAPLYLVLVGLGWGDAASRAAMERHLVLPFALVALAVGVGLATLDGTWLAGVDRRARRGYWHVAAWIVVGLSALLSYPRANLKQRFAVEDHGINCLSVARPGSLVLGQGTLLRAAVEYARTMLGVRTDVRYLDLDLLARPWYARRLPRHLRRHAADPLRLIQAEMRHGGVVYLARPLEQRERWSSAFAAHPVGPLMQLMPPGRPNPPPARIEELNRRVFRGLLLRGQVDLDPRREPEEAHLRQTYALTWRWIARELLRAGDQKGALRALLRGQRWAPWLAAPDWFGDRMQRSTAVGH